MMKKAISLGKLEVVEDIPTTPLVSASKKKGVSKAEGIKRYIDDILSTYIPDRGGVSTDAREGLKADILELVESAVVATVSHIPESKKVFTVADVNAMFKESMKEVLPEIVEAIQSGNKSIGWPAGIGLEVEQCLSGLGFTRQIHSGEGVGRTE